MARLEAHQVVAFLSGGILTAARFTIAQPLLLGVSLLADWRLELGAVLALANLPIFLLAALAIRSVVRMTSPMANAGQVESGRA